MKNTNGEGLFVTAHIVDVEVKARKGKEINAVVDVVFTVDSYENEHQVCVKESFEICYYSPGRLSQCWGDSFRG